MSTAGPLFTIGHGDRALAVFIDMLREARVETLIDVRRYPGSRRHPQFGRDALAASLAAAGIGYRWEGEALGGRRRASPASRNSALRSASFRGYADHMMTPDFRAGLDRVLLEARMRPVAIMCAERHPSQCHRQLIVDAVLAQGMPVVHLLEPGRREAARLHEVARVEGDAVIYDVGTQRELL